MSKGEKKKRQIGKNDHAMKVLLQEEFGSETGDYNSHKAFEILSEAKSKQKSEKNKKN
jgi:hypothetical protein